MTMTLVCVVGSNDDASVAHARTLGALIAAEKWVVVTGGRRGGVQEAALEGAKSNGGLTVGIVPNAKDISPHADIVIHTDMNNGRNNINVLTGRVTVACGDGGPGTLSEVALALKNRRPVILLGCSAPVRAVFESPLRHVADTPQAAIETLRKLLQ